MNSRARGSSAIFRTPLDCRGLPDGAVQGSRTLS